MKVKMVDVARRLGVSKATVSLAVNNKPGVNEETRKKVLQCIEEMKQEDGRIFVHKDEKQVLEQTQFIKVVIINHGKKVVCDPELDLWSDVLSTFDMQARKMGYLYGLTYMGNDEEEIRTIVRECNLPVVAGVIIFATEMEAEDCRIIRQIHKPVVLYDYDMEDGNCSSVCIDNIGAVRKALNYCREQGADRICYFATDKTIYNFKMRREAYLNTMIEWEKFPQKDDIVPLGNIISEIAQRAEVWLKDHELPDAAILENYQVTIGVAMALRKLGIAASDKLKLVGIDEVPEYMRAGIRIAQMKIPHADRAAIAMDVLNRMIHGEWKIRTKIFAESDMIV